MELIKKYFIPHKGNDHKPHMVREIGLTAVFAFVLIFEIGFLSDALIFLPHAGNLANVISGVVALETSNSRTSNSLGALNIDPVLTLAAQAKADDMAAKGYFAHVSPEGTPPWFWIHQAGYTYEYAGENLAINFYDSKDVVNAWMKSPEHRDNILNSHYTDVGIATADGTYQGAPAKFIVEFFGRKLATVAPATNVVPPKTTVATNVIVQNKIGVSGTSNVPALTTTTPTSTRVAIATSSVLAASSTLATTSVTSVGSVVNGTEKTIYSSVVATVAKPRQTSQLLFYILALIVGLPLILSLVVKTKKQHPRAVASGALLLAVIVIMIVFNHEIISSFGHIG